MKAVGAFLLVACVVAGLMVLNTKNNQSPPSPTSNIAEDNTANQLKEVTNLRSKIDCKKSEAANLLDEFTENESLELTGWNVVSNEVIDKSEPFAWNETDEITPCASSVVYSNDEAMVLDSSLSESIHSALLKAGWDSNPQKFKDRGMSISLAHAGGPTSQDTVFLKEVAPEKLKFIRIREVNKMKNFWSYRQGNADSVCPCSTTMHFEVSGLVDIETFTH